jgi:hypothetical protein
VIDTVSAKCRLLALCGRSFVPEWKRMLHKARILVLRGPDIFRYSQDLMAKKKAPMKSSHRAKSAGEMADL